MLVFAPYYGNTQTYYSFWNENLTDDLFPYLESGLHLFTFDADLFETTFYVTTRLQKDRYGRLIDLEHVNPKSKEAFARKYEGKVETFKPYTKYYSGTRKLDRDQYNGQAFQDNYSVVFFCFT